MTEKKEENYRHLCLLYFFRVWYTIYNIYRVFRVKFGGLRVNLVVRSLGWKCICGENSGKYDGYGFSMTMTGDRESGLRKSLAEWLRAR